MDKPPKSINEITYIADWFADASPGVKNPESVLTLAGPGTAGIRRTPWSNRPPLPGPISQRSSSANDLPEVVLGE